MSLLNDGLTARRRHSLVTEPFGGNELFVHGALMVTLTAAFPKLTACLLTGQFCRNGRLTFCLCSGRYLGTMIFNAGFPNTLLALFFSGLKLKSPKQSLFVGNGFASV